MATKMALTRRQFVRLSALSGIALFSGCTATPSFNTKKLVGCATDGKGNYMVAAVTLDGELVYSHPLVSRGHGITHNQRLGHMAVFARRPGYYIDILHQDTGKLLTRITPIRNRFFYGHGVYDNNTSLLFVTEGVTETCEGVIGIYDVSRGYQRVGEWQGFGIGPHQVEQLSNGVLVIAVGGIQTKGREKTNLDSMTPSLIYLDPTTGESLQRIALEDPRLSIRHLAIDAKDEVFFAQQLQRTADETPSQLLMRHKLNNHTLRPLNISGGVTKPIQYIGSIAVTEDKVIASAPRASEVLIFDKHSGRQMESLKQKEACGIATDNKDFYTNNFLGQLVTVTKSEVTVSSVEGLSWDNHWTLI